MKFEVHTYTAPSCWASYLINGDATGISDDDRAEADKFVAHVVAAIGNGFPVDCSEPDFMWRPDFGMAGDCCTYSFLQEVQDKPVNGEGLTLQEWLDVAGPVPPNAAQPDDLRKAWEMGEDPTEYRALWSYYRSKTT
jgi:hypothetical protein